MCTIDPTYTMYIVKNIASEYLLDDKNATYLSSQTTVAAHLTPNSPLRQTCFTYPKLNMDGFSLLAGPLWYGDSTQEKERNSLHAQ